MPDEDEMRLEAMGAEPRFGDRSPWMVRVRRKDGGQFTAQLFCPTAVMKDGAEVEERIGVGSLTVNAHQLQALRELLPPDVEWQYMELIEREEQIAVKQREIAKLEAELVELRTGQRTSP